jgi:hypothetical protein
MVAPPSVIDARIIKDTLRRGRLPGINVGHDADVARFPELFQYCYFSHLSV